SANDSGGACALRAGESAHGGLSSLGGAGGGLVCNGGHRLGDIDAIEVQALSDLRPDVGRQCIRYAEIPAVNSVGVHVERSPTPLDLLGLAVDGDDALFEVLVLVDEVPADHRLLLAVLLAA